LGDKCTVTVIANKGHDYGVGALTETQRLELLEYLKGAKADGT